MLRDIIINGYNKEDIRSTLINRYGIEENEVDLYLKDYDIIYNKIIDKIMIISGKKSQDMYFMMRRYLREVREG